MSSIKDLIEYRIKKQSFVKCIRVENLDLGEEKKFKMFIYKNTIDNYVINPIATLYLTPHHGLRC